VLGAGVRIQESGFRRRKRQEKEEEKEPVAQFGPDKI